MNTDNDPWEHFSDCRLFLFVIIDQAGRLVATVR